METPRDWRDVEWDGAVLDPHFSWVQTGEDSVGTVSLEDNEKLKKLYENKDSDPAAYREGLREIGIKLGGVVEEKSPVEWESEPPLSAEQWVFFPCG